MIFRAQIVAEALRWEALPALEPGLPLVAEIARKERGGRGVRTIWMRGMSRRRWRNAGARSARPTPIPISGNIGTSLSMGVVVAGMCG